MPIHKNGSRLVLAAMMVFNMSQAQALPGDLLDKADQAAKTANDAEGSAKNLEKDASSMFKKKEPKEATNSGEPTSGDASTSVTTSTK